MADASVEAVRRLRADEFPIIGYTWFPLFSLFRWSYRSGRGPLGAYLTDVGLWTCVTTAAVGWNASRRRSRIASANMSPPR